MKVFSDREHSIIHFVTLELSHLVWQDQNHLQQPKSSKSLALESVISHLSSVKVQVLADFFNS